MVCTNLIALRPLTSLTFTIREELCTKLLNRNEHQFEKVFKGSYKEETAKPTKSANGNGVHA
jgi:hypothetical protein